MQYSKEFQPGGFMFNIRSQFSVRSSFIVALSTLLTGVASSALPLSPDSLRQDLKIVAEADPGCALGTDPAETPYRFTNGSKKYTGQCLNTEKFRVIKDLKITGQIANFYNFKHEEKFWQAEFSLRPENIESVFFQILRFPVMGVVQAGHGQLRFKLKNPISLKHISGVVSEKPLYDIVVSFEGAFPKGESYNFALGAMNNYSIVGRLMSPQQKFNDSKEARGEQYLLDLTALESSQLLEKALVYSQQIGARFPYNTLRPNCISEALDLIDSMPRFKDKYPPFLTMISNDPVAQPAIEAIQARGILKSRVQDYRDEMVGVFHDNVQLPTSTVIPFLPQVKGYPWSLVITLPDEKYLSSLEAETLKKVRQSLIQEVPNLLQGAASATRPEAGDDAALILKSILAATQERLLLLLNKINSELPLSRQSIGLYLVPYKGSGQNIRLDRFKIPAMLPLNLVDLQIDLNDKKSKEVFYYLAEGARLAADAGATEKSSMHLMGAALRINLQKNASQAYAQVMFGLKGFNKAISIENKQVKLSQSQLTASSSRSERGSMLLTLSQTNMKKINDTVNIEFGPEGGLVGDAGKDSFALFQINKDITGDCRLQAQAVPVLLGQFSSEAIGNGLVDQILNGKAVAFQILSAAVNTETEAVSNMDIKVRTWPMSCLSKDEVNVQFTNEANDKLINLKSKSGKSVVDALLSKILNP
jgi:hypothetical protein